MKRTIVLLLICISAANSFAQLANISNKDTICGHKIIHDNDQRISGWFRPDVPGAVYNKVIKLASEFIKEIPVESQTGLPMYLVTCCFEGSQMTKQKNIIAEHWASNPACIFAGLVQSLAVRYRVYSGDDSYLPMVKRMLDYQLDNGTTPSEWIWAGVPYASADPFSKVYQGATEWESDGNRGDGLHVIEPDKVGELGYAYLCFFEITGDRKYLDASVKCADALARHIRNVNNDGTTLTIFTIKQSPWPFRVNARTGVVVSDYCSNALDPARLLDELIRIESMVHISDDQISGYKKASDIAWKWLFSKSGPMTTFIWNGYFEDIPNDPDISNRVQITPMELAKYLVGHPGKDSYIDKDVPSLIYYVANAFKTNDLDAIREQTWCYEPMCSHTARYGSACAIYYERSGDLWYKDQAYRFLNVASYMTYDNGAVAVGPNWPGSWFSDGYGDYIRHFLDALAAVPEWAPADEDHLLRSTSVVQKISYQPGRIEFTTFDDASHVVLRMVSKPFGITVNDKKIDSARTLANNTWTWTPIGKSGIVRISYSGGNHITITK